MVGSAYKVIVKIMADRLKTVMFFLVGDMKSIFIAGRYILDGVLIVNEAVY